MIEDNETNEKFEACPLCGATGEVWDQDFVWIVTCPVCDGTKMVKVNEQTKFTINESHEKTQVIRGGLFR